jgi:Mrr N-terminal domain
VPSGIGRDAGVESTVSESELSGVNSNGQSKFENKVSWARFYLTKAGLIDGEKHGLWALTSEGRETQLDQAQALAISKDIRARFKPSEDDDEPAPEAVTASALFDDPTRKFWFVSATWAQVHCNLLCMGCSSDFARSPPPRSTDDADHRLPARIDVDVLDRDENRIGRTKRRRDSRLEFTPCYQVERP